MFDKPVAPVMGQFRQAFFHLGEEGVFQHHGRQVRIREVAVVVGFFLRTHGPGLIPVGIVQSGFLDDRAAVFQDVDLPFDLVPDGLFHETERVDVFQFCPGAQFRCAQGADGDIGVATERSFLHVPVGYAEIADQGV